MGLVTCMWQRENNGSGNYAFSFFSIIKRETIKEFNAAVAATAVDDIATAAAANSYCSGSSCFFFCCCYQPQKCLPAFEKPLRLLSSNTKASAVNFQLARPNTSRLDSPTQRQAAASTPPPSFPPNSFFCQRRASDPVTSSRLGASALISTAVGQVGTASSTAGHGDQYAVGSPAALYCGV